MKKTSLILLFLFACIQLNAQSYTDSVLKLRNEHLTELKDTNNHILNLDEINHFAGLDYFSVNESFIITANFKKSKGKKFKMPTSGTRTPVYRRYGYIDFKIGDTNCRLTVYQNVELSKSEDLKDYLFIPFRDLTSSKTTYGGGRYLDFTIPNSSEVIIDFNLAYNPYCAYSHRYSCPIPPAENTLKVEITAGEKYVETIH